MKKIVVVILVVCILALLYVGIQKESSVGMTGDQAIALIKKTYPEYSDYPSDNLPIKRIETVGTPDGWRVGMYIEGSGLRGILKANCFLVSNSGSVTETGLFQGEGPATSINLSTCTPEE